MKGSTATLVLALLVFLASAPNWIQAAPYPAPDDSEPQAANASQPLPSSPTSPPGNSSLPDALSRAGKLLAPELEKFDYRIFAQEASKENAAKLQVILAKYDARAGNGPTKDNDDAQLAAELRQADEEAPRPNRPLLTSAHIQRLYEFGVFAGAAYCPGLGDGTCTSRHCKEPAYKQAKVLRDIVVGATRGFVAVRPQKEEIVVSFRGSNNFQNWLDNLDMRQTVFPYVSGAGNVHTGFLESYERARNLVRQTLSAALGTYPGYKVVFTGHSLGGAIAAIAAGDMGAVFELPKARLAVVTFGSPRPGDATFARWLSQKYLGGLSERMVQENDVVPHVPPTAFSFQHPHAERYVLDLSRVNVFDCGREFEDPQCANSRVPFIWVSAHTRFLDQDKFFGADVC